MYCSHCGAENNNDAQVCRSCGAVLTANAQPVQQQPVQQQPEQQPVSYVNYSNPTGAPVKAPEPGKGFAIAGMVCGIVSFFCFGVVLGILGIVFGVVARNKGYTGGMATAGIVCGIVGLSLYFVNMVFCGGWETVLGLNELTYYY